MQNVVQKRSGRLTAGTQGLDRNRLEVIVGLQSHVLLLLLLLLLLLALGNHDPEGGLKIRKKTTES